MKGAILLFSAECVLFSLRWYHGVQPEEQKTFVALQQLCFCFSEGSRNNIGFVMSKNKTHGTVYNS